MTPTAEDETLTVQTMGISQKQSTQKCVFITDYEIIIFLTAYENGVYLQLLLSHNYEITESCFTFQLELDIQMKDKILNKQNLKQI